MPGPSPPVEERLDQLSRVEAFWPPSDFAVAADESAYITGQIWAVNGGLDM